MSFWNSGRVDLPPAAAAPRIHSLDLHDSSSTFLASSMAPGTCGELIQGAINGEDFLINCPINLFSYAEVHASSRSGLHVEDELAFSKIKKIAAELSGSFDIELSHQVHVSSSIPRGKGMASSTADISAALQCICNSLDLSISRERFARILTSIEPSDCIHFPGIAHVNHLSGRLVDLLPSPRELRVLVVDCGGEVETVGFDRERARAVYRGEEVRLMEALYLLKNGLHTQDAVAVAQAATMSAMLSQKILYKPQFSDLLALSRELGALGVNCAHSGTVLGVLYRPGAGLHEALDQGIRQAFGHDLQVIGDYRIIGGGCYAQQ